MLALLLAAASNIMNVAVEPSSEAAEANRTAGKRDRNPDRWAADEQPAAILQPGRRPNERWKATVDASMPAGGKNSGRKVPKLGPYYAPSKEAAELKRNEELDDWLHTPTKRFKAGGKQPADAEPPQAAQEPRAKRHTAAPGSLAEQPIVNSSRTGQRGAGPGCAYALVVRVEGGGRVVAWSSAAWGDSALSCASPPTDSAKLRARPACAFSHCCATQLLAPCAGAATSRSLSLSPT